MELFTTYYEELDKAYQNKEEAEEEIESKQAEMEQLNQQYDAALSQSNFEDAENIKANINEIKRDISIKQDFVDRVNHSQNSSVNNALSEDLASYVAARQNKVDELPLLKQTAEEKKQEYLEAIKQIDDLNNTLREYDVQFYRISEDGVDIENFYNEVEGIKQLHKRLIAFKFGEHGLGKVIDIDNAFKIKYPSGELPKS